MVFVLLTALFSGANAWIYEAFGNGINLAVAVTSGIIALAVAVSDR